MKLYLLKTLPALLLVSTLFLGSCKKDKCTQTVTYKKYVPIYMSYADLRSTNAIKSEAAQPLKNPGKIYLKGNYIFVNEQDKGIHVIDNSNPSAPQNIAFIDIPGNLDLAAAGNVLYADNYVDLLALDISNPTNIRLLKRVQDALPYRQYTYGYSADPQQGIVTDWKQETVTEKVSNNCDGNTVYPYYYGGIEDVKNGGVVPMMNATSGTNVSVNPNTPGIGGSSARFTIASNTLYIVDDSKLNIWNISSPTEPVKTGEQALGWSIQTIFPYNNHLFIGSSSGVYIYDISNPLSPNYISVYNHITACDPVVVDDHYAYFTLSNDAPCHMGINQLEVVDITNLASPSLAATVPMTNPKGVGIDNKTLFICDSQDGLKVYDATDVSQIGNKQIAHFSNINSFDVIPYNHHLLMVGSDGLYQYDYNNIQNISLLSTIPVVK